MGADRLRLLVLAQGYPCPQNPMSGAYHRPQMAAMMAEGVEATLVVPVPWVPPFLARRNPRWAAYDALPAEQQDGLLRILRPRYLAMPDENRRGMPDLFQLFAVRRALARIGYGRPDAVHAFFGLPTGAVARSLARGWNIPFGVSLLGDDVNIYPHLNSRNLRLLQAVLRDAAVRVANGPTIAALASRLTGTTVDSLSIGVSAGPFAELATKAEARRSLNLPPDRIVALYVGAVSINKGMDELRRAMGQLNDLSLTAVVVGDGPLRSQLEGCENVVCLGMCPPEQVRLVMAAADFLVHPSYYEGLPTVLVEGALAGLPILTTDAPGCIDLATEGRALVVPAKDAAALAGAIREMVADPQAARARAEMMSAHVRAGYLVEDNTTHLIGRIRAAVAAMPLW